LNKGIDSILVFGSALLVFSIFSLPYFHTNAQHHRAPPPLATIGDRNIIMNFTTEPKDLIAGKAAQIDIHLTNKNSGEKIQHVTYRVTVSKEDQTKVSELFH
jgi:hypothetical protein